MTTPLYLSLGSNIEPSFFYLRKALLSLSGYFQMGDHSMLYRTAPQDDLNQDYFFNLCVKCYTDLFNPYDILEITQRIEKNIGRQKSADRPKGPRTIDIDIILFGDEKINEKTVTIPHKSWKKRNFVLIPLLEVDEELGIKYPITEWIKENRQRGGQQIECLGEFTLG